MSINVLPSQISIAAKTTNNAAGGAVVSYATKYANVAALVTDATASLQLVYQQRNIVITHIIYLYQQMAVNTGDIVVFGGRLFFINSGLLDPSGTGRIYQLLCKEMAPGSVVIEE